MSFHWKVLLWMIAGVAVGLGMQAGLEAPAWSGAHFVEDGGGLRVSTLGGPSMKSKLAIGDVVSSVVLQRGTGEERTVMLPDGAAMQAVLDESENGDVLWFVRAGGDADAQPVAVSLGMTPDSPRATWIYPFEYAADIFMALLKMLIVPLVLTSIASGVASIGSLKDLRRLGGKTFAYYMGTSLLAIVVGQTLVNLVRPGVGAELGLSPPAAEGALVSGGIGDILRRTVPSNVFTSLTDNGAMLQIIFFALLFGYFITRTPEPHGSRARQLIESLFEVMMKMAEGVLKLLPYGVFALLVKVVASTGFGVFKPLLLYMGTVAAALILHACVTLPLVLKFVARISPVAWFRAMSPALMTAFSTSSSSMTLPVTLRTVEHRGRVSNKVTSFTLPLGATINMDGTALYECIGVIFLAQYYAGVSDFVLTFSQQGMIVLLALLASVGAAGIPSAGLVMMLTILSALGLPLEGAALLLAVDRPLDMLRTVVNVWSDSCGAATIARTEGETGPLEPLTSG
ncbi:MAG: proton glutamate symport protein [Chlamydiales bacterium]|jgi:proton glutamate symport protein